MAAPTDSALHIAFQRNANVLGCYAFRHQGLSPEAQHRLRPAQECGRAIGVQDQPAQRLGDQADFAAPAMDRDIDSDM